MKPLPAPGTRIEVEVKRGLADEFYPATVLPDGRIKLDDNDMAYESNRVVTPDQVMDWRPLASPPRTVPAPRR